MADGTTCKLCGGPWPSKRTGNSAFGRADTPVDVRVYHGPEGHCPSNVCADCWHGVWADAEARWAKEQDGTQAFAALYMIAVQGFTQQEAAEAVGVHRNTIGNWKRKLRQVVQSTHSRVVTKGRGT